MSKTKAPAPEGILLHRIEWDYFITLTHAPACPNHQFSIASRRKRDVRWVNWVRAVRRKLKIHSNSFLYVKRIEIGRGGREHFHALLNFHKRGLVNKTTRYVLGHLWDYGWSNIRDCKTMGATAYITKVQNEYESNRFAPDRFRAVEFSKSALKSLRRLTKTDAVHTGH
tara:strand:+ start:313 stop:819 length:507 start_codon:yes stop_codon:yes gene_type:complete